MPNNLLNSVIGNIVANRQRLSSIRQRIGLEPQGTQMRELAPSPRQGASLTKQSAEATAVQAALPQITPDRRGSMLQQVASFVDQYGEQQQQLIDQRKPRPAAPASREVVAAGQEQGQIVRDQKTVRALAPLADFFRAHGRLPTVEELRTVTASRMLGQQLGRQPTDIETRLWLEKAPKVM